MERLLKPCTFAAALVPFGYALYQVALLQAGAANSLGADPAKALVIFLGEWTINFLLLTLAVTPVRRLTGWNRVQRIRRMLGLYTFFYASLHFACYLALLLELNFAGLGADLLDRPYITVGFLAYVLLLPLALTSTDAMVRRLKRNWAKLHKLVYPAALAALVHLVWIAKASYLEAAVYAILILTLLAFRLFGARLKKS